MHVQYELKKKVFLYNFSSFISGVTDGGCDPNTAKPQPAADKSTKKTKKMYNHNIDIKIQI